MISFPLFLVLLFVACLITAALVFARAFEMGVNAGWDQGFEFANTDTQVRFRKTYPPEPPVVLIHDLYQPENKQP